MKSSPGFPAVSVVGGTGFASRTAAAGVGSGGAFASAESAAAEAETSFDVAGAAAAAAGFAAFAGSAASLRLHAPSKVTPKKHHARTAEPLMRIP